MKKVWLIDLAFLLLLGGVLFVLSGYGEMQILWKLPYITLMVAYFIGRMAGYRLGKAERKK